MFLNLLIIEENIFIKLCFSTKRFKMPSCAQNGIFMYTVSARQIENNIDQLSEIKEHSIYLDAFSSKRSAFTMAEGSCKCEAFCNLHSI